MDATQRLQRFRNSVHERPLALLPSKLADVWAALASTADLSDAEARLQLEAALGGGRAAQSSGTTRVAVLPVYGAISARNSGWDDLFGGTSVERLTASLNAALADPGIDAIVLDVDSPGGTVDGVPELAARIRAARGQKPIYAVANGLSASAAYWVASQADRVYVTASGSAGSIGVFAAHEDISAALEQMGSKITLIASAVSPFKTEGNPYEPLSDDARSTIQTQVDALGQMFVSDVAKGRGVPIDTVRKTYGQGRLLLAKDALAAGMVDEIAPLDDVVRAAARAAQVRSRAGATAAGETTDLLARLGTGLEFSDRLALVTAGAAGLVAHARSRADMRAKQGRSLSESDRTGLLALAGSLTEIAGEPDEETEPPAPESTPEPPARAFNRARHALALAEAGI